MFRKYELNDTSKEAKAERRNNANIIKYVILAVLLILLTQPIYYTYLYWVSGTISFAVIFLLVFELLLWSWCIYKVWKFDFSREEDREDG